MGRETVHPFGRSPCTAGLSTLGDVSSLSFNDFVNMCHDPRPEGAPRRVWRDYALLAIAVPTAVIETIVRDDVVWPAFSLTITLIMLPLLLWRRSHPLTTVVLAFGAINVANMASLFTDAGPVGLYTMATILIFAYSLFRWGSGREATIGFVLLMITWAISVVVDYTGLGDSIGGLIVLLFPIEFGSMVRFQAKSRQQEIEQAKSLTREQLARELHDTVAHHVSAIAIQAQGGRAVAAHDPEKATEVLAVIEEEASRALTEMRNMVGALRDSDDAELAPQPGIADIANLADVTWHADPGSDLNGEAAAARSNGRVGPVVDVELNGDLDDLRPSVDTAVYRLAQESVTNALRHARSASRVLVRVEGTEQSVKLTVHDDGFDNPPPSSGNGFGLVGMAERAKLLGGTLSAGPSGKRGWTVNAVLPRHGNA